MGDVIKLGDVPLVDVWDGPKPTQSPPPEAVWDGIEWVSAAVFAKREAGKLLAQQAERWRAAQCPVSDDVDEGLRAGTLARSESTVAIDAWHEPRTKPWLVLSGPTGCGKSVAVAQYLWTHGGRFVRADEIVRLFSSMFGDQYEQQQKLRDVPRLVIDDVGGELDATRMLPALLDLLDSRKSARNRPTIVTTNLSKKEFAARYANERLMSRMAESVQWAAVGGDDLRRRKQ